MWRHGRGTGDIGISAEGNIEEGALRPFQQNRLALEQCFVKHRLCIGNVRAQALPIAKIFAVDFFEREWRLTIDLSDHAVLLLHDIGKLGPARISLYQLSP